MPADGIVAVGSSTEVHCWHCCCSLERSKRAAGRARLDPLTISRLCRSVGLAFVPRMGQLEADLRYPSV